MKLDVLLVVTARASWARVYTLVEALDQAQVSLVVAAAAGAVTHRFEADIRREHVRLACLVEPVTRETAALSAALLEIRCATLLGQLEPRVVVVIADRPETLAVSHAALLADRRIVHLLGGEVSGTWDDRIRRANTQLADVHLVAHQAAGDAVRRQLDGRPARVEVTGCPSADLLVRAALLPPPRTLPGVGDAFDPTRPYAVVVYHPTREVQDPALTPQALLDALPPELAAVVFWPGPDPGVEAIAKGWRQVAPRPRTRFVRAMDPLEFARLLAHADILVGNSSAGVRETCAIGLPTVDVGLRQSGRLHGPNVVRVLRAADLAEAVRGQLARGRYPWDRLYGSGDAGRRMADAILSLL